MKVWWLSLTTANFGKVIIWGIFNEFSENIFSIRCHHTMGHNQQEILFSITHPIKVQSKTKASLDFVKNINLSSNEREIKKKWNDTNNLIEGGKPAHRKRSKFKGKSFATKRWCRIKNCFHENAKTRGLLTTNWTKKITSMVMAASESIKRSLVTWEKKSYESSTRLRFNQSRWYGIF